MIETRAHIIAKVKVKSGPVAATLDDTVVYYMALFRLSSLLYGKIGNNMYS